MLASSALLAVLPSAGLAAMPWWDKKPTEWSPSDIDTILHRSGWTRQASPEFAPDAIGTGSTAAQGLSDKRLLPDFKLLVRWESGLPVRLARKMAPASNDGSHYMLSMSRLPMAFMQALSNGGRAGQGSAKSTDPAEMAARVAQFSFIRRDGKDPLPADQAYWSESDFESRIMISFSKGRQPIELTEREVTFVSRIGDLIVRAPFFLKEMLYHGKLEL